MSFNGNHLPLLSLWSFNPFPFLLSHMFNDLIFYPSLFHGWRPLLHALVQNRDETPWTPKSRDAGEQSYACLALITFG